MRYIKITFTLFMLACLCSCRHNSEPEDGKPAVLPDLIYVCYYWPTDTSVYIQNFIHIYPDSSYYGITNQERTCLSFKGHRTYPETYQYMRDVFLSASYDPQDNDYLADHYKSRYNVTYMLSMQANGGVSKRIWYGESERPKFLDGLNRQLAEISTSGGKSADPVSLSDIEFFIRHVQPY
ncbi:hypothetical protein [Mucilaginibacter paludis]|uniref:Uncharacterized protein n=1 Tax=Mucilaginibacter paludis DSM 18603 TaxID=714943 RepID=H1YBW2_9SPHI|nr:hypothetical protein [Mucilaginibacter paludis]EHQ27040.1 hypothetical protein Mucpa_2932 [Mucilaginibacter paludis DSM 18603]